MKNSFLDMMNAYNQNLQVECLYKEENETYYIFYAKHWYFKLYLDEINRIKNENRILVYINNIIITPTDYIIEEMTDGVNIRFKKANFPYKLTNTDIIYFMGDVEFRG